MKKIQFIYNAYKNGYIEIIKDNKINKYIFMIIKIFNVRFVNNNIHKWYNLIIKLFNCIILILIKIKIFYKFKLLVKMIFIWLLKFYYFLNIKNKLFELVEVNNVRLKLIIILYLEFIVGFNINLGNGLFLTIILNMVLL